MRLGLARSRPLPQQPMCRGIPLANGSFSGCSYGLGEIPQFSGDCDCPVCHGSGIEDPEATRALFSQPDWLEKLKAELRAEIRNEIAAELLRRDEAASATARSSESEFHLKELFQTGRRGLAAFVLPLALFGIAGTGLWLGQADLVVWLMFAVAACLVFVWRHRPQSPKSKPAGRSSVSSSVPTAEQTRVRPAV
jgi:hypothetical protein